MTTSTFDVTNVLVSGLRIELLERGSGSTIVLLHGHDGVVEPDGPFIQRLALTHRVVEPVHPGFGAVDVPEWMDSIDDLAYVYLALLARLDIAAVTIVGLSMGAWIAAELATKCLHRIARLVLVNPVGIRVGDRDVRDIPDIFAITPQERIALTYADVAGAPNVDQMSDDELARMVRNDQAAALFLWQPYMCNPKLRRRLASIDVPTLIIRGESDGIVSAEYAEAYGAAIPGATLNALAGAGHVPQFERPVELAGLIEAFVTES